MKNILRVKTGDKIDLSKISTDATGNFATKDEAAPHLAKMRQRLDRLQEIFAAENKRSLLVIFQAMDTGGKDGAARSLLSPLDPTGLQITSFKAPTSEELDHDFLWRVHQKAPGRGIIGVWNRSHYEDVLIVRVHGLIDKKTCEARYKDINAFEKLLCDNGTTILKFYLHISKKEQKRRLQARLDRPEKHWKFNPADLNERAHWDDYQKAYEDAINACSTEIAPWHIVSADSKWARDIAVTETVLATMEKLNPQFPIVDFDPKAIIIK
jgi:PPK2 family polyphosphate:nucleotide phosphotransferase